MRTKIYHPIYILTALITFGLMVCEQNAEDLVSGLGDSNKVRAFKCRDSLLRMGHSAIPILLNNLDNLNISNQVMDILVEIGSESIKPLISEIEEVSKREPLETSSYLDPSIFDSKPLNKGLKCCVVLQRIGIESSEEAIKPFMNSILNDLPSRPYYLYLYHGFGEKTAPLLYEYLKMYNDQKVLENIIFLFENFPKGLKWIYTFIDQENYEKLFHIPSPYIRRFIIRSLSYEDFGYFRGKVTLEYPADMKKDPSDPLPSLGIGCVNIFRKNLSTGMTYLKSSFDTYKGNAGYSKNWDREERKAYLDSLIICYRYMAEECKKKKRSGCERKAMKEIENLNGLLSRL